MTSDQANWGSSGWLDYQAYAAGEPNLRDVIISLGANDILQGESEQAIETSLLAVAANLAGQALAQSSNAHVNVFITTIPPLGLPTDGSDQRETNRENVNSWILGGAGTASVQNLPGTVPHFDVTSAYPSGGLSAPADYQGVATLVANDIAAWMAGGPHSASHPVW
jgi:hypothetical protein